MSYNTHFTMREVDPAADGLRLYSVTIDDGEPGLPESYIDSISYMTAEMYGMDDTYQIIYRDGVDTGLRSAELLLHEWREINFGTIPLD